MTDSTTKLEAERSALLEKLATTDDMRRGSISKCYRKCGKPTCACTTPDHRGHGPYYAITKRVNGKTKTLQLRPGPLLTKIQREVDTYREFRATCEQLFDVDDSICDARSVELSEGEKKRHSVGSSKPKSSRRSKPS